MLVLTTIILVSLKTNLLLINQGVDVLLWGWIFLIMCKRVVCRGFDLRYSNIISSLKSSNLIQITRKKLKDLIQNHHYYSDILLLFAALIATCQLANQLDSDIEGLKLILFPMSFSWLVYRKLIIGSILIKYKTSQPKLFIKIIEEIKRNI